MIYKQSLWWCAILTLMASLLLVACGGGGSSDGGDAASASDAVDDTTVDTSLPDPVDDLLVLAGISGPMDQLQDALSRQVLLPMAVAAARTPLYGALECLNIVVVNDGLDVIDSVMRHVSVQSLGNPQNLVSASEADVQQAVTSLAGDLGALQSALTGGDCIVTEGSEQPLAGTPLAALGDALAPVLATSPGDDMNSYATYVGQLSSAFDEGLASLTYQDLASTDLAVMSGILDTLQVLLSDLSATLQATAGNDLLGMELGASQTIENLLNNVLTGIVPVGDIDEQSGFEPVFSNIIAVGVSDLMTLFSGGFGSVLESVFDENLDAGIAGLLMPLDEVLLPALYDEFSAALTNSPSYQVSGTPLDAVLDEMVVLDTLIASAGGGATDTSLDLLLDPVYDLMAAGYPCPLIDTYMDGVCSLVQGVLDAQSQGSGGDPIGDLTGTLDDELLGGLVDDLLGGLTGL